MADRFDKFTERARRVLSLAQQEAGRLGHSYFGTEHLLLGLVAEKSGIAAYALSASGVQLPKVRAAIEQIAGRGQPESSGEIGLTPPMKQAIEQAVSEARRLNHHFIGTEHLLLGVLRVDGCMAIRVLLSLGVEIAAVRAEVMALLASGDDEGRDSDPADASPMPPPLVSPPQSPELREALEQLARLRQQEHALRARIGEMQRAERRSGTPIPPGQAPPGSIDFDRFTERAKRVLTLSQEEAQRFNHNYIGTEHLLLGLVREGDGIAARVLFNLGIHLPGVRSAVEFIIGRGETMIMGEIGLTPRAKTVLALAVDEAWRLNHTYIGTEHLLLGLVREGEGIAAGVLESKGVALERLRAQVIQVLSGSGTTSTVVPIPAAPPQPQSSRDAAPPHQLYLGTLLQVIPIVQQQERATAFLVAIALERYDNGFAIGWRVRLTNGQGGSPVWECTAEDDRGNRYRSTHHGGSADGGTPDDHAWRFAHLFGPALDPAARSLTVECAPLVAPHVANIGPDTWRFTVAIPPLPAG